MLLNATSSDVFCGQKGQLRHMLGWQRGNRHALYISFLEIGSYYLPFAETAL